MTPEELRDRISTDMPRTRGDLESMVRHASIAFPGFPAEPVDAAAAEVVRVLREAGAPEVRLLEMKTGFPVVFAEVPGPEGSPTVLLYAHYDVQPPGDLALWESDPFEPIERDGRLYGRGTADDKSGVAMHAAVIRAFEGAPPCTLRVIVEGEEEYGGNFEDYPREHPELFDVDAIVVADCGNVRVGQPTFTTTLRGLVDCVVEVRTADAQRHSGMFGGPAPDALLTLIRLLDSLTDEQGNCAIEGLVSYEWQGADYPEDEYRATAGIAEGDELRGDGSLSSRLFSKPAVTVIGLDAPAVDTASNSLVPYARACVSLRLAPGQDADRAMELLVEHLRSRGGTVTPGMAGSPFACATTGPAYDAARRAMEFGYGLAPVEIGAGGTIPLISVLAEVAPKAELLLVGAMDSRSMIHAPNESVDLGDLEKAALAEAVFILEYAQ
jgi:acetylornithine deacetylase/succinyl-diaminopimelate desuccinylase-like protein